ncbi:MAG: tetratricopeptide repeat protein, partial [Kangiellaceae bacterium]|nr:tetratricopeptide repeat protein [Kangiellaceae bacterium]
SSILNKVKDSGFTKAISVPRTLKTQLAKKQFYQFAIDGSFEKVNGEFLLNAEVIDVLSGQKIAEHSVQGQDYFILIDELSDAIKDSLNIPNDLNEQALDLPVSEHVSNSKKAIQLLVEAQKKRYFDNDYPGAKELLSQAVEEDFSFAAAYGILASVEQLSGNSQAAGQAIEKALKHEYKFTTQEKFDYKADVYAVKGDYESQSKVYDMWVELFPDSILAHRNRATLLRVTGLNHDKALESLKKIRELNPYDDSVLRDLAKLYVLKDELDKAVLSLESFIKNNPQNTSAMVELADVYDRQTEFDEARSTLDKVLLLDQDNIEAALKVVRIDMKLNKFESADNRLNQLYSNAQNPQQKFTVLLGFLGYYSQKGEINKAIETALEMEQNSQHLPPLLQIFMIKFQRSLLMASVGQVTEALGLLKELQQQLQQPYSGMIDLAIVSVHTIDKNIVEIERSFVQLEEYFKQYPNPFFEASLENTLGRYAELKGEFEKAVEHYAKALEGSKNSVVNSTNEDVILQQQIQLARVLHASGQSDRAETILRDVLKRYPTMPTANIELAYLLLDQGKRDEAISKIELVKSVWANADTEYFEYKRFAELLAKAEQ